MADGSDMADTLPKRKKGRHPEKKLSAAFVRTVAKPGKYLDGHGLFLKVEPTGARRWVQRIVIRGRRQEIGLGPAALVSLAEARDKALDYRKLARAGGDPLQEKRDAAEVPTFEEAACKVHEMHKPSWRNPKHADQFINTLKTYAFPRMGRLSVAKVSTADVMAALAPIWLEKAETARRVRQRIGMVMKWAVAQGWRKDNPADAIATALPKQDRAQEHRKALPYVEVPGFLKAVQESGAGLATKLAIEFLVLTATRSGEVREATWGEIDLAAKEWRIPASRMKAKVEHRVPLSASALAVLDAAKALGGATGPGALVFPGTKPGKPLSDMTLSKLTKELGFPVDIHGFRTSFRTWAQEQTSFPREVVEKALAHTIRDKAEAAYARSDLFERRVSLMEEWDKYLNQAGRK